MVNLKQLVSFRRIKKLKKTRSPKLNKNPQKKIVCFRILNLSPKKPNSANRRVIKGRFINSKNRLIAKIPGESHNLQQHSTILIHGAKIKDLIGVSYKAIRGVHDLLGVLNKKKRRSIYGVKKTH